MERVNGGSMGVSGGRALPEKPTWSGRSVGSCYDRLERGKGSNIKPGGMRLN